MRLMAYFAGGAEARSKSVRRDVVKLEQAGMLRTYEETNPGHGRVRIVEPVAVRVEIRAVLLGMDSLQGAFNPGFQTCFIARPSHQFGWHTCKFDNSPAPQ